MSTKKLQIIDYSVKQAENADTLDGKHAVEFAAASDVSDLQTKVGDTPVADQIASVISVETAYFDTSAESTGGTSAPLDADTLGGVLPSGYVTQSELNDDVGQLKNDMANYRVARNLLDNSDFRNPVNQRGATSYIGTGYTIDRWENNSKACKLTVEDGYIHMQNNSDSTSTATQFIRQKIENPSTLIGKTITIAARIKGNCRLGCEGIGLTYPSYVNCADWTTITLTVDISAMTGDYIAAVLQGPNKSEWYCSWIALYEGSYTADTLPPYVSKGYAQELAECLRYCKKLSIYGEYRSSIIYSNSIETMIPLSVPLRAYPNISGTLLIWNTSGAAQDGFTFSVSSLGDDYVRISANKTGHGLTDAVLRIQSDVILSADL